MSDMIRFRFVLVIGGLSLWIGQVAAEPKRDTVVKERKLVHVTPGPLEEPIRVSVGDMIQLQPFKYANVPAFEKARISVESSGDRVFEIIGHSTGGVAGDGISTTSTFLYVREPGSTTIKVTLLDKKGKAFDRYQQSYKIEAK